MLTLPLLLSSLLLPATATLAKHQTHHHQRSASIHLFHPLSASSAVASSSSSSSPSEKHEPSDANAIVSAFLGIENYEMLRDGLEVPSQLVMMGSVNDQEVVEAQAGPLMILADKLGKDGSIEDYVNQRTLEARPHHSIDVSKSPESDTWHALLSRYTERLVEKFGYGTAPVSTERDGEEHVKRFLLPGSLNGEYAADASMQDDVYEPYMQSLAELASLEQSHTSHIHLTGLKEIAHKYGRDSQEVQQAKEMMRLSLESVISSYPGRIAFFVVPASHPHTGKGGALKHLRGSHNIEIFNTYPRYHALHRRQQQSPSDVVSPLVPTTSQCFSSNETCTESSNSCYGHGVCVQGKKVGIEGKTGDATSGKDCWVCKCGNVKKDGKTKYFSGEFCQKEDVSGPFFLLVGSTIFLLLVMVGSVSLLSSVGGEPLPSTLAALGGGHSGHAKRD